MKTLALRLDKKLLKEKNHFILRTNGFEMIEAKYIYAGNYPPFMYYL